MVLYQYREKYRERYEFVYASRRPSARSHLLSKDLNPRSSTSEAVCGKTPWPDAWMGTGSWDERESAIRRTLCRGCRRKADKLEKEEKEDRELLEEYKKKFSQGSTGV